MDVTGILSTVSAPITEAVKWAFHPLKRQIIYLTKYKEHMENLQHQADDLQIQRNDLQNRVDEAERRFEERTKEVAEWLRKADSIQLHVANVNQQAQDENTCLKGLCPDVGMRRRLSKHALEILKDIERLHEKRNFSRISYVPPPRSVEIVQRYWVDGLESRNKIMKQVLDALHDESIRSVGVYGMGGSGKTTLMKSLINEVEKIQLFEKVIMLTVSQSPDLNRIQNIIADRLGLDLKSITREQTKLNRLLERLKKEVNILIILDDVWNPVKFTEIGIPCGDEHLGCKFVVTTRDRQVCR